jgi:BirA family biotin operon repressor/biotin-[acetyl-CoA-carboxylase] ligase
MIDGRAPLEVFDEIDSTIMEARRRAEQDEIRPVWIIAKRQTAGRGRRGRAWISPDGNLLVTLLFATDRPLAEVALLGFATGVAIAETFEALGAQGAVTLKWPNDVMVAGAKTAGILIDSGALDGGRNWVALAFGVNIAVAPEALDQPTTCLRNTLANGAAPQPLDVFAVLRPRLETWAARLVSEGFAPLRDAWLQRAHGLGAEVQVRQGEQTLAGRVAGLSPRGELELDTPTGRRLISAGDIYFSNAA